MAGTDPVRLDELAPEICTCNCLPYQYRKVGQRTRRPLRRRLPRQRRGLEVGVVVVPGAVVVGQHGGGRRRYRRGRGLRPHVLHLDPVLLGHPEVAPRMMRPGGAHAGGEGDPRYLS